MEFPGLWGAAPNGPSPECQSVPSHRRFAPPDQARFSPPIRGQFSPPGVENRSVLVRKPELGLNLALQVREPPGVSWTICEFGFGGAPRRRPGGTLSSSTGRAGLGERMVRSHGPSVSARHRLYDHVRLQLRTFGRRRCGSRYLALGPSGVRHRKMCRIVCRLRGLHDEDDVPVPLQLPQTSITLDGLVPSVSAIRAFVRSMRQSSS